MPTQSYPIGGKVYDNNWVPIEGATVYAIDTTTGEQLESEFYATTISNGEYMINLQNLTTYTDGDNYELVITKSGYDEVRITGTINQAGGGDTIDIHIDVFQSPFTGGTVREFLSQGNYKGILSKFKRAFMVWVNNQTLTGTAQVLTSGGDGWGKGFTKAASPVINLEPGQSCYVEQVNLMLRTDSKSVTLEVVKCTEADGGGTADAVSGQTYSSRGTATRDQPFTIKFANPIRIEYNASTALSVGMQVTGADSSTLIDASMEGYVMEDAL